MSDDQHRFRVEVLSPKLVRAFGWSAEGVPVHVHWCPGCGETHQIWAELPNHPGGPVWSYNGDPHRPTFGPSINISWGNGHNGRGVSRCHYFIVTGMIQFCPDSTHYLAGQSMELPDFPPVKLELWRSRGFMNPEGGV